MLGLSSPSRVLVLASVLSSGCAGLPAAPLAKAPASAPPAPVAPAPVMAVEGPLPTAGDCPGVALDADDPRCPVEVIGAAATSWLDKTTAVFDGVQMHVVEYDPVEITAEAQRDPAFARLLADADSEPRDGILDGAEARVVEARVLEHIDARHAARWAAR